MYLFDELKTYLSSKESREFSTLINREKNLNEGLGESIAISFTFRS